jgi:hypothetical protein
MGRSPRLRLLFRAHLVNAWTIRSDKAHRTFDHVNQLRELVEAQRPQPASYPGDPSIALCHFVSLVGIRHGVVQRPELDHREGSKTQSAACLDEKDRAGRIQLDREGDHGEERAQQNASRDRHSQVKAPLYGELWPLAKLRQPLRYESFVTRSGKDEIHRPNFFDGVGGSGTFGAGWAQKAAR